MPNKKNFFLYNIFSLLDNKQLSFNYSYQQLFKIFVNMFAFNGYAFNINPRGNTTNTTMADLSVYKRFPLYDSSIVSSGLISGVTLDTILLNQAINSNNINIYLSSILFNTSYSGHIGNYGVNGYKGKKEITIAGNVINFPIITSKIGWIISESGETISESGDTVLPYDYTIKLKVPLFFNLQSFNTSQYRSNI
jgi:hypothetical protein